MPDRAWDNMGFFLSTSRAGMTALRCKSWSPVNVVGIARWRVEMIRDTPNPSLMSLTTWWGSWMPSWWSCNGSDSFWLRMGAVLPEVWTWDLMFTGVELVECCCSWVSIRWKHIYWICSSLGAGKVWYHYGGWDVAWAWETTVSLMVPDIVLTGCKYEPLWSSGIFFGFLTKVLVLTDTVTFFSYW